MHTKFNEEHYKDETARLALRKMEVCERKAIDLAIQDMKKAAKSHGFAVLGRIVLRGEQTGKMYF